MNPLVNLLMRLELLLQQADSAVQELSKQLADVIQERDELKKLLETKGGEA